MIHPVRWLFWVCCAVAVSGCTKPNPNACCTNEAECLALGSDELRPCDGGEVCSANACVPVQCETGDQCSGATPYCVNQLCVGSCQVEADCEGVPGAPICAADHVCVGCRDNADCSGTTPICDAEDRQCRGCEADGDCASGICLEADGVCAVESEVVFVVPGRSDTGECTKLAPCGTLEYALTKANTPRTVIRIDGGQPFGVSNTVSITGRRVYIDSSGSTMFHSGISGTAMFNIGISGNLTVEGVHFSPREADFLMVQSGTLRMHRVRVNTSYADFLRVSGTGHLIVNRSIFTNIGLVCRDYGSATIEQSSLFEFVVYGTNCNLDTRQNSFSGNNNVMTLSGGSSIIENNLFRSGNELADVLFINMQSAGSRFVFNTIVNTTGVTSEGQAIGCDSGVRVENNIFAYRSTAPNGAGCIPRFSLYDDAYPTPPGEGNQSVPFDSVFLNPTSGDFRPAPTSSAREMSALSAEISVDHDGRSRPLPAGTRSDVGAFEVP